MFLGESQDAVFSFMRGIEWAPKISGEKAGRMSAETRGIFEAAERMGLPVDKGAVEESENLRARLEEAAKNGDMAAFGKAVQEFEGFKKKVIEGLLSNYK